MGSWLALISSAIIGGMVLLQLSRFNNDVQRDSYLNMMEDVAYNNLEEVLSIVEYDFARIGQNINDPSETVVLFADSTDFQYQLDSNGDGVFETMRYYLSDTTALAYTDNPRDRILYRVVNGGAPEKISSGLTEFEMTYYNEAGAETTNMSIMKSFGVRIVVESEVVYDGDYSKVAWQTRVTPTALVMY